MNKNTEEQTEPEFSVERTNYSLLKRIGIVAAVGALYAGLAIGKNAVNTVYNDGLVAGMEKAAIVSVEVSDLNKDGLDDLVMTQKDGKKIAQIQGANGQYSGLNEYITRCINQEINDYARSSIGNSDYVAQRAYAPKSAGDSAKAMSALKEVITQTEQEAYALQKTIEDQLK